MSIEDCIEHFEPLLPPEEVHPTARYLLANAPVVHSDLDGGFWVVNRHADVMRVMRDSAGFASGNRGVRVPDEPVDRPPLPPIDSNPPMHRFVRNIENPYLVPKALSAHEATIRRVIADLIDEFVADGRCDVAAQLGKVFPADITFRTLFGIVDREELDKVRTWVRRLNDTFREEPNELAEIQQQWTTWCQELIDRRRVEPGRADILDGLLRGTVEGGRPLTDLEIIGAIQILSFGGFNTTADATANIVIRLIDDPGLEALLRERPEAIPHVIDEILRLEPPVTARPRRCTRDVEIGGKLIREGDRVLCNYLAANIDPDEWDDPDVFSLRRSVNRVMTFGVGPHRCIGSNLARMSLRVLVEELLARITNIQFADDRRETRTSYNPSSWRGVDSLLISFTALPVIRPH